MFCCVRSALDYIRVRNIYYYALFQIFQKQTVLCLRVETTKNKNLGCLLKQKYIKLLYKTFVVNMTTIFKACR